MPRGGPQREEHDAGLAKAPARPEHPSRWAGDEVVHTRGPGA
jgi:hypothetical protein